jgi:Fic family protein
MKNKDIMEFLSESNKIEGVYDEQSLVQGKKAWDYLMKQNELTVENICKAHGILMKYHLPATEKGHLRQCNVRVGSMIAPDHSLVRGLLYNWLISCETMDKSEYTSTEVVKFLHVVFERIHPFVDGNGRIGRIIFNWQIVKKINQPVVVFYDKDKQDYYKLFNS